MNETPDIGRPSASHGMADAEAAMAWQAERFPQVAACLGNGAGDFLSVTEAWRRETDWVDRFLEYQARFAAGMDERTRGAHLIAFYSHHLGIAAGCIYLKTGLIPDLDPDSLAIRFEAYGLPEFVHELPASACPPDARRFHFRFKGFQQSDGDARRFHDAFIASLGPVVEAVQARTGLSAAAQWRLAADGITGAFLEIGAACGDEAHAMAEALAIVKTEGSPLFSNELHYERIDAVCGGVAITRTFRLRSGCCLFYRTDGGDFCDVCVLLDPETQTSRLRAHLERAGSS